MLPVEIIIKIFSYNEKIKCYRCNTHIFPLQKRLYFNNKCFCSAECIEYQHY